MRATRNELKSRIGEEWIKTNGESYKITEVFTAKNMTVQFNDGTILKNIAYSNIKLGKVKNPYRKSCYNIGYLGNGPYSTNDKKLYGVWNNLIERCYSPKIQHISYKGCSVVNEWHNFQSFGEWYSNNYIDGWELDKDILIKGNKIYGPETCCFVPHVINSLFVNALATRGNYPIGVIFCNTYKKFNTNIRIFGEKKNLGYFDTVEEAFQLYKDVKENHIKAIANNWKTKISEKVYNALINYKVDITD